MKSIAEKNASQLNLDKFFIPDKSVFKSVRGKTLFYPCSGMDLMSPIALFSDYIDDFWFVDRGYFSPGHQDIRFSEEKYDRAADRQPPVLDGIDEYVFLGKDIRGPVSWKWMDPNIEPCLVTEKYLHRPTGRQITVRRRRGYGYSAFRTEKGISPLGVFFYRGDSMGEGGSGNMWFKSENLAAICSMMSEGGFIVTDGSGSGYRSVRKYWSYGGQYDSMSPEELVLDARPFTRAGFRFTCVGYAGERYGPTLIWKVSKV